MKQLILLMTSMIFLHCAKDPNSDCLPSVTEYEIYKNTTIEASDYWFQLIEGNNLVFQYYFQAYDCLNVNDDEYYEYLAFEIDPSLQSFNLIDDQLIDHNCYFYQKGAWSNFLHPIQSGYITGNRSNDQWKVEAEIEVISETDTIQIQFSSYFNELN